ncbi:MAG: hypothetical protein ACREBG_24200, partial [Pyrinomonadaceae bacterium]
GLQRFLQVHGNKAPLRNWLCVQEQFFARIALMAAALVLTSALTASAFAGEIDCGGTSTPPAEIAKLGAPASEFYEIVRAVLSLLFV